MATVLEVERQYSVKSAAVILDTSEDYVLDRIKDGELPRIVDLGSSRSKYRIPASDLQRFIDSRTSSSKMPGAGTPGENRNL